MGSMPTHDRELGFEGVDAGLWTRGASLGEVAIYDIPFSPLNPATGFEHSEDVAQELSWVVGFDDADEVADVDDIVFGDQVFGDLG